MRPVSTHSQRVLILTCQFRRCQARPERNSLIFYEPMRCQRPTHRKFSILRRIYEKFPRNTRAAKKLLQFSLKGESASQLEASTPPVFLGANSFVLLRAVPGLVYPLELGFAGLQASATRTTATLE